MTKDDFITWRNSLGLRQKDAAERLGLAANTVRKYERGETDIPLYVALACAALSFNLPPWRTAA
jgi:transcriptional regulator with XRE-family HTH domain